MLDIKTFILGQLQTNTYLLTSDQKNCYLIDPADDFVFLSDYINQKKLNLKGVVLTHGHFDHSLAVSPLKMIFKVPLLASSKDLFLLKQIHSSSKHWTTQDYPSLPITKVDFDFDKIKSFKFDDTLLTIIKTPGHTPGSISIYCQQNRALFSGDTLFKDVVGRTNLSYSDSQNLNLSLKKLLKLPQDTIVYPGHGSATNLAREKANLSYLF